jgi:hypothetical protein
VRICASKMPWMRRAKSSVCSSADDMRSILHVAGAPAKPPGPELR